MDIKLIIIILLVIVIVGVVLLSWSGLTGRMIQSSSDFISKTPSESMTKESCPFECCVNDEKYQNRICQENYQCVNNQCIKPSCPYECCLEGYYQIKQCSMDYECINNQCVAKDSDKDGLTDIEEKQLGTNINLADSDGDTLNDYQEVKVLQTNPLNANTDGDRYNDNLDPNPTTINTANIIFTKSNEEGNYDYFNLIKDGAIITGAYGVLGACTGATLGACAVAVTAVMQVLSPILNDVIYTANVDITFTNQGNDYTNYVNYDVVYFIGTNKLKSESNSTTRLDAGSSRTISYSHNIKLSDIQYGTTWDLILGKSKITIDIENLNYERF